jgi:hypothetical protein
MDGDPVASALVTAFTSIVAIASPDRVVRVLRPALVALLEDEACPAPGATAAAAGASKARTSRNRSPGDITTWAPLRTRILAVLADHGLSRRQLADQVGIRHDTAAFAPAARPGAEPKQHRQDHRLAGKTEPADAGLPAASTPAPPVYRLNTEQRERLAGYRELDERAVRKTVVVTPDIVSAAVAGESLAPELIGRLVGFLEQQSAARGDAQPR